MAIVEGVGWGVASHDSHIFDIYAVNRALFDGNEWISTWTRVMMVFDCRLLNMAFFDRKEGFSTDAD